MNIFIDLFGVSILRIVLYFSTCLVRGHESAFVPDLEIKCVGCFYTLSLDSGNFAPA